MSTESIHFESFVEWDNSPFLLFGNTGKILYLNHSAELLVGAVNYKQLFQLALDYAPENFGYTTTSLPLNYDTFMFHAITIGYENEEQISLRLYHTPHIQNNQKVETEALIETNINMLLEANIMLFQTQNNNQLTLLTDQELPEFKIDQNTFSKLLRKTLHTFRNADSIHISLKLLIGQHMLINNQRVPLAELHINANGRYSESDKEIHTLATQCQIKALTKECNITLEIPLIQ
jgi:hypothetical protein